MLLCCVWVSYRWLNARWQYLQCITNGDTGSALYIEKLGNNMKIIEMLKCFSQLCSELVIEIRPHGRWVCAWYCIMAADDIVLQGTRPSTALAWMRFWWNILMPYSKGHQHYKVKHHLSFQFIYYVECTFIPVAPLTQWPLGDFKEILGK